MQYITIIPPLTTEDMFRRRSNSFRCHVGESTLAVAYGREALGIGLDSYGIVSGDEVLMPAVICDVVLDVFSERDIRFQYYGLSESLEFDIEDIEARIGHSTKAIYLNHAFGMPMQVASLRKLCDRRGLILIEDCAHALGGIYDGASLGSFGDFAIYSYRKFFPLPNGGGLRVNRLSGKPQVITKRDSSMRQIIESGKLLAIGVAASIGAPGSLWRQRYSKLMINDAFVDTTCVPACPPAPSCMSVISEWILSRANFDGMIARRRDNFLYMLQKIKSLSSVEPLFKSLLPGQVPYSFPLRVERRERVVSHAAVEAIVLEPTLARVNRQQRTLNNPNESFDTLDRIAEQVVSLPVHQVMTRAKLDRVIDVLRCGLEGND